MQIAELTKVPAQGSRNGDGMLNAIPFEMAVLPNGLTLIVHENRLHPLVCTHLLFNVGSKDEPPGRTGFAHLFEHLMFKESANRSGNWHRMLQSIGGAGVNGTTNTDRTNYFQAVPKGALDRLLWMESDRMGHLLGGIDAASLADEVSVVKNEKRQREGAPYGGVFEAITTALYPRDHPYGHTVLGSFEDLDNVNLETVADWHSRWYGAWNAVLVLAGDIGFDEAVAKVEHWFGAIPAGMPVQRITQWLPEVRETKRVTLYDRVPFRRLCSVWSTPGAAELDSALLAVVARFLTGGVQSRLHRRLVDSERLCQGIGASQDGRFLCGQFEIVATLVDGADAAKVETAIAEELDRFIAEGPSTDELERFHQAHRRGMRGRLDNVGQIAGNLAWNMMLFGRPDGDQIQSDAIERSSCDDVRGSARRWLRRKAVQLDVRPIEPRAAKTREVERNLPPALGRIHASPFPKVDHARLDNGLAIQLARQPGTHRTEFALHLPNGSTLDPVGLEGLSRISLGMLDAGTSRRSKVELAETFAEHQISFGVNVSKNFASMSMGALDWDLAEAMNLMAEILTDPAFPDVELRRFIDHNIAALAGTTMTPVGAAGSAVPRLIYGATHEYGRHGGNEVSLTRITRGKIVDRHLAWLDPALATLVVVGDLSIDKVAALAHQAFGSWSGGKARVTSSRSRWSPEPGRYFIDRPGGPQSALHIALAAEAIRPGNQALSIFNKVFGGSFGSRLNANLRERKGWTYGANSGFSIRPRLGDFQIRTQVQADKTMDALAEIEAELAGLLKDRPISNEEIEDARNAMLVSLPMLYAGNQAILSKLMDRIVHNLPDDYDDGSEERIRSVSRDDVEKVAGMLGNPADYSWVVAGDAAHLPSDAFALIDAEGNRL